MRAKYLLLLAAFIMITACSSIGKNRNNVDESLSETELYQMAQQQLNNNSYLDAVRTLKALESRYPFGQYAEQAQLELIYAYYRINDSENTRAAADRFIRLHPDNSNVDYAYYMRGISSFEQDRGFLSRWLPLDMTRRDPGAARDSFNEFAQLTSRFPNSIYAPDAKARMVHLRARLAAYEIHVGHYYLTRKAYVAAANRGSYVVENYQGTPAVADGLALMVEAYKRLQLDDLAETSLEVLKANYPNHPTLVKGNFVPVVKEEQDRNWFARMTLKMIDHSDPLPPGYTRGMQDIERQYWETVADLPEEVKKDIPEFKRAKRSWKNILTFGLLK